eukprot:TRINITY_DN40106_c0_g1_i1.p1 TRINITY_DN40106_c0_g1~~TRINITY_DN40106_c0_g1_i1.p1  ORF type:complete len:582 (-),score=92.68 TRINITY_DN40106_c0_g1_i1:35-1780(-)
MQTHTFRVNVRVKNTFWDVADKAEDDAPNQRSTSVGCSRIATAVQADAATDKLRRHSEEEEETLELEGQASEEFVDALLADDAARASDALEENLSVSTPQAAKASSGSMMLPEGAPTPEPFSATPYASAWSSVAGSPNPFGGERSSEDWNAQLFHPWSIHGPPPSTAPWSTPLGSPAAASPVTAQMPSRPPTPELPTIALPPEVLPPPPPKAAARNLATCFELGLLQPGGLSQPSPPPVVHLVDYSNPYPTLRLFPQGMDSSPMRALSAYSGSDAASPASTPLRVVTTPKPTGQYGPISPSALDPLSPPKTRRQLDLPGPAATKTGGLFEAADDVAQPEAGSRFIWPTEKRFLGPMYAPKEPPPPPCHPAPSAVPIRLEESFPPSGSPVLPSDAQSHALPLRPGRIPPPVDASPSVAEVASPSSQAEANAEGRLCCHLHLHMVSKGFELVPIIIGRKGCNTGNIARATQTKLRIRGRGSGHKERETGKEAPAPLMLAITTEAGNRQGFFQAVQMALALLNQVEAKYKKHCNSTSTQPALPAFSLGPCSEETWQALRERFGDALSPKPLKLLQSRRSASAAR